MNLSVSTISLKWLKPNIAFMAGQKIRPLKMCTFKKRKKLLNVQLIWNFLYKVNIFLRGLEVNYLFNLSSQKENTLPGSNKHSFQNTGDS